MLAFAGPAYIVSVGYMDPGNWATDLLGGSQFGYRLLWVLVMSNAMAILLQTLGARLGIVSGRDLAQACRETYPRPVNLALWFLCEIAIVACDLAEVLGAAIALNLLFHIPLLIAVALTALDTLLVLWLQKLGIRYFEAFILSLIAIIAICFAVELFMAKPDAAGIVRGLVPFLDNKSLLVAMGMIGATVMPHNLYLHSALVQTRQIGQTIKDKQSACKWNLFDCTIALNVAMFINCAILILAAAVFYRVHQQVDEIQQAYLLLAPLMGTPIAAKLFGVALFASGQSSTLTGTLAGQIIMEGFLNIRVRPWLRRLVTRALAIVPAFLVIWIAGSHGTLQLLLLSQVVLSLQLPFAIVPLIHFTNDPARMGQFASGAKLRLAGWTTALVVIALNLWMAQQAIAGWAAGRRTLGPACLDRQSRRRRRPLRPAGLDRLPSLPPPGQGHPDSRTREPFRRRRYRPHLPPHSGSARPLAPRPHRAQSRRRPRRPHQRAHLSAARRRRRQQPDLRFRASTAEVEAGREYLDSLVDSLGE